MAPRDRRGGVGGGGAGGRGRRLGRLACLWVRSDPDPGARLRRHRECLADDPRRARGVVATQTSEARRRAGPRVKMRSMRATACLVALVSWRTVLAGHKDPASTDATQDLAEAAALLANASRPRVRAALTTFIDAEPLPVHKDPASTDVAQDLAEAAALLANASRPRVRAALTTFIDAEPLPKRLFLVYQIARSGPGTRAVPAAGRGRDSPRGCVAALASAPADGQSAGR